MVSGAMPEEDRPKWQQWRKTFRMTQPHVLATEDEPAQRYAEL
jgi:hypothetical protein